jgi:hypothetical protein
VSLPPGTADASSCGSCSAMDTGAGDLEASTRESFAPVVRPV